MSEQVANEVESTRCQWMTFSLAIDAATTVFFTWLIGRKWRPELRTDDARSETRANNES